MNTLQFRVLFLCGLLGIHLSCPGLPISSNAPALPPAVQSLLEAQGTLEAGLCLFSCIPEAGTSVSAENISRARAAITRIYPACRASLAGSPEERAAAALEESFFSELSASINPDPASQPAAAMTPVYPPDFIRPDNTDTSAFGTVSLLDDNPRLWSTPALWSGKPQPPQFAGWKIEKDLFTIGRSCATLIRSDIQVDGAELSGELRIDDGDFLFLVIRSDIIVKFHAGPVRGSGGNITVKIGYDNLRTSTLFSKGKEIEKGEWFPFQVTVSNQTLKIIFRGEEAFNTTIARDPRLSGSRLARAGYFGLGGNACAGAFRNIRLTALTTAGRWSLPRLQSATRYHTAGSPIRALEDGTNKLISLVHDQTEPYQPAKHSISNGTLFLEGAPYVQLSRNDLATNHFLAAGRIMFENEGTVWIRANKALLFGIRNKEGETPFPVKHTTTDFNSVDEENDGERPALNEWHSWELEYHHPVGTLRFNGKTAALSLSPEEASSGKLINQLGISTYNTKARIDSLVVQKLAPGTPDMPDTAALAAQYLGKGLNIFDKIASEWKTLSPAAAAILTGAAPASPASPEELRQIADRYRQDHDWPAYLALLDANIQRFPTNSETSREAEKVWKEAKKEYDTSVQSTAAGEIGLDNILRLGDKPGSIFPASDGKHVWVYLQKSKELLKLDPSELRIISRLPVSAEPGQTVARKDYLICTEPMPPLESLKEPPKLRKLFKIDLQSGAISASTNFPETASIIQLTGHPKQNRSYVSVNENEKSAMLDMALFKIYELNETTMELKDSGGHGMFIEPDPAGRYLYSAFHLRWRPGLGIDFGCFLVKPRGGSIDHLVRYRVTAGGLVFDAQRTAPGIGGMGLCADPSGRLLCYVAQKNDTDSDTDRPQPFALPFLYAARLTQTAGILDPGGPVDGMDFNPMRPAAYLLSGAQVREFDLSDFSMKRVISMPAIEKARYTRLIAAPDGNGVLAAFTGKKAGIYLHRWKLHAGEAANRGSAPELSSAQKLMADGRTSDAQPLLLEIAKCRAFTSDGEEASRLLLDINTSRYTAPTQVWQEPHKELTDDPDLLTPDKLVLPAINPAATNIQTDIYDTNDVFAARLIDLLSYRHMADEYPYSWLWLCHQAEQEFPNSARLKLEAARRLLACCKEGQASILAKEVLDLTNRRGNLAVQAFKVLASIYRAGSEKLNELAALSQAASLAPRDAGILSAYASSCETAGLQKKARNISLMSWYILPSQPELVKKLTEADALPAAVSAEMDASALFRHAVSSVALVSHKDGSGTGFLIGRNGLLLTNHHVVDGADKITVKLKGPSDAAESSFPARVVRSDALADVALLQLDGNIPPVAPLVIVNSDDVQPGDNVVAIGNPGIGTRVLMHTTTEGIISGKNRVMGTKSLFQISAAVNPGNSGGPLLNKYGQVVGMVTMKADLENVGFAVPGTELLKFLAEPDEER